MVSSGLEAPTGPPVEAPTWSLRRLPERLSVEALREPPVEGPERPLWKRHERPGDPGRGPGSRNAKQFVRNAKNEDKFMA